MLKLAKLIILLTLFCVPAYALEVGTEAPDFTLPDLDGKSVRLSDLRGRIIVLKLATTWCPTCSQQSRELAKAEKVLKEQNVAVVEVFLQDSVSMVRDYQGKHPAVCSTAVLLDDDRVRKAYSVYLIPRTLIIDREFRIRRDGSLLLEAELSKEIKALAPQPGR